MCVYTYTYIYIERERERYDINIYIHSPRRRARGPGPAAPRPGGEEMLAERRRPHGRSPYIIIYNITEHYNISYGVIGYIMLCYVVL